MGGWVLFVGIFHVATGTWHGFYNYLHTRYLADWLSEIVQQTYFVLFFQTHFLCWLVLYCCIKPVGSLYLQTSSSQRHMFHGRWKLFTHQIFVIQRDTMWYRICWLLVDWSCQIVMYCYIILVEGCVIYLCHLILCHVGIHEPNLSSLQVSLATPLHLEFGQISLW